MIYTLKGDCDQDGYEWTSYFNSDDPSQDGDFEIISSHSSSAVCRAPIAIQAANVNAGSSDVTHIDLDIGFYCVNGEQDNGQCADFEVRYCCPKTQVGSCSTKGYEWTSWLSRDTAAGSGDWEMLHSFEPNQACSNPIGAKVTDIGGDGGSRRRRPWPWRR